jgi:hypothetical protein
MQAGTEAVDIGSAVKVFAGEGVGAVVALATSRLGKEDGACGRKLVT